jgi:hypothetical protein
VPDAAGKFDAVFLDAHAAAPPVAFLATGEIGVDHVSSDRQAGWNTLEDGEKTFPVGLPRVQISQHDGTSGI